MGSMSDKIVGKANEVAGQARQGAADVTGDEKMRAKGAAQEIKGNAQQAKGNIKEAIKGVVDRA